MSSAHVEAHVAAAEQHYSDKLEYHNWNHALEVLAAVKALESRVTARNIVVNADVLHVAAAWHDAGYHADHRKAGSPTKEHYSARLAANYLSETGQAQEFIDAVGVAILGTQPDGPRTDMNALVLHRADLENIGSSYESFKARNIALFREVGSVSWHLWAEHTRLLTVKLAREAQDDLIRLGEPIRTPDAFDVRAIENGEKLVSEPVPEEVE